MPRVHHVKKARKDHTETIKKGDSYYWWKFRYSEIRYSTTYPKASQLTQSAFLSEMYSIQEDMAVMTIPEDELDECLDRIDELRDMAEESLNNMPEQLQEGDTGIMLQDRIDAMEQWRSDLEGIDVSIEEGLSGIKQGERLEEIIDDIANTEPGCA